jgi:hypothetical protein
MNAPGADRRQPPGPTRYRSQRRDQGGVDRSSDEVVTARNQNDVGRIDRRNTFSDGKSGTDGSRDVLAVDGRDREPVLRAEPVGFREHLGRPGGVQQLDAIENNDHYRARCRGGISHPPIVSVSVGKMADQP